MSGDVIRDVVAPDVPAVAALVRDVLAEFGLAFGEGCHTDRELLGLPDSHAGRGGAFWVALDGGGNLAGTCGVIPVGPGVYELRKNGFLRDDTQVRASQCTRGYCRPL